MYIWLFFGFMFASLLILYIYYSFKVIYFGVLGGIIFILLGIYLAANGSIDTMYCTSQINNMTDNSNILKNQYGEMWHHDHTGMEYNFDSDGIFYNLTMDNSMTNAFTFNNASDYLEPMFSGIYKISYMASGSGENNHKYYTSVTINGVVQDRCESHKKMSAGGDIITMTGCCILNLSAGDKIKLATADIGNTGTGIYYTGNLNLIRIDVNQTYNISYTYNNVCVTEELTLSRDTINAIGTMLMLVGAGIVVDFIVNTRKVNKEKINVRRR